MQVRAILEAACDLKSEGVDAIPEIMIPLVGLEAELTQLRELVVGTAEQVLAERDMRVGYTVGTMIELPRACVVADTLAPHADFFSFGTSRVTMPAASCPPTSRRRCWIATPSSKWIARASAG